MSDADNLERLLHAPTGLDSVARELERVAAGLPTRIDADPERVEKGLAQLVLTLIDFLRRLMESQALKRMEDGSLTEDEIDRMGTTFMRLEARMEELKQQFGLEDEDLNLNLGPLGDLM